jgi:sulfite reductase (NADPH) hemoprotein beta-component
MYAYTEFDRAFIAARAAQYRGQLQRHLSGDLPDELFRPLRLQNGWYVQRYAPMLRVAVPYGELSSRQLRVLARVAREFDVPDESVYQHAAQTQSRQGSGPLPRQCAHFTTRQNLQFNWIPLQRSADVMELLASADLHGIQTSGNCIRNITSDALAGIAPDEVADPRPFCEILRQWSTLHPEFAYLPRKFKVAVTGATEDRAAIGWHDLGLQLVRATAQQAADAPAFEQVREGDLGFRVLVGGGMGRTPIIGSELRAFLPWAQVLNHLEAVVRVYNRWGRRDNMYKARIKILVKAEGERFREEVAAEYQRIVQDDGAPHTIGQAELDRVSASFVDPALPQGLADQPAEQSVATEVEAAAFARWQKRNVHPHRNPALRAVSLSFKRLGYAPGDATADQLDAAADLAERFSGGEARVTHEQNLLLPWVHHSQLWPLWQAAKALGVAQPNIGLLTDLIACPGGDFCSLANARSIPVADAIAQRYQDLDELDDLGQIDLHISGCINSCGHHHSGHIGVLGVDKDGQEWYQITLGGSDGTQLSGAATPGKVIGPSFAAAEVVDVVDALLQTYRLLRVPTQPPAGQPANEFASHTPLEPFVDTVRRVGLAPFREAADAVRVITA